MHELQGRARSRLVEGRRLTDNELADTYRKAMCDYEAAESGDRVQAFITMLVAEKTFTSRFGVTGVLRDYRERYSP